MTLVSEDAVQDLTDVTMISKKAFFHLSYPRFRQFSGDARCTEAPGLLTMHTLFMLEHNRIARELHLQPVMQSYLQKLSEAEQDEVVYQETRRLLAATHQAIVYKEFLPAILGPENMRKYELELKEGTDSKYDPNLEPTIWNEFATFAFR